jgi:hypothetical protein
MNSFDLYELLNNAGISFDVLDILDGSRILSIKVTESENEELSLQQYKQLLGD